MSWWRGTALVAQRSLLETLRSRTFRIVTAVLLSASVAAVVVPQLVLDQPTTYTLATVGDVPTEIRAALPRLSQRLRFSVRQTSTLMRCFISPTRMATRLAWLGQFAFSDPAAFAKPAMVITGEPGLDRVVRPELTRRYLDLLPQARHAVLQRTGHLGVSTRPDEFAALVRSFLDELEKDVCRASA